MKVENIVDYEVLLMKYSDAVFIDDDSDGMLHCSIIVGL